MPEKRDLPCGDERWARFRFSVIGRLLASPPEKGELKATIAELAQKQWRHPVTSDWTQFGHSTIERWYYKARKEASDPVGILARKVREDQGSFPSLAMPLREELRAQYQEHPNWSYRLHADNLAVWAEGHPDLGSMPFGEHGSSLYAADGDAQASAL